MVQKLYGNAKFLIWSALVDAYVEYILTDVRIRAETQAKNCPCNQAIILENEKERDIIVEAINVLGSTFGKKTFNMDNLKKAAWERIAGNA